MKINFLAFLVLFLAVTALTAQDSLYTLNRKLTGHTEDIEAVAWSPNGKLLASAGWDSEIRVYQGDTPSFGKEMFILKGHMGAVTNLEFSKDNKYLASCSKDFSFRVYSMLDGSLVFSSGESRDAITRVMMDPKAKFILSGSLDGKIRLYEILNNKFKTKIIDYKKPVNSFTSAPDGRTLYIASDMAEIDNIDFAGKSKRQLKGHSAKVNALALSPNGKQMASCSDDKTVIIWDLVKGTSVHVLAGHTWRVTSVDWSKDGLYLASTCNDGVTIVWDVTTGKQVASLNAMGTNARSVAWSPRMDYIAVATLMDAKNFGPLIYNAPFLKLAQQKAAAAEEEKKQKALAAKEAAKAKKAATPAKGTSGKPKK